MPLESQRNTGHFTFTTLTKLRALSGENLDAGDPVFYSPSTDQATESNTYYWNDTSIATDNGAGVIKLTDTPVGRLLAKSISVFNAKDFGAVGDGTTDDTTAIQDALDAAGPGGTLIIEKPSNFYLISTRLNTPGDITIIGRGYPIISGSEAAWAAGTFGGHPLETNGSDNVKISGMGGWHNGIVNFNGGSSHGILEDCVCDGKFNNGTADSLGNRMVSQQGAGGSHIAIKNCHSKNYHWHYALENERVTVTGEAFDITVTNGSCENELVLVNLLSPSFPVGVYSFAVNNVKIRGMTFKNIRSEGVGGQGYGVYEGDSVNSSFPQENHSVDDCVFIDDNTVGVSEPPMVGVTQRTSRFVTCTNSDFFYDPAAPGSAIRHLSEASNGSSEGGIDLGPHPLRTRSCLISGCMIYYGDILVQQTWLSVKVLDNHVEHAGIFIGNGNSNEIVKLKCNSNEVYFALGRSIWKRDSVERADISLNDIFDGNQDNNTGPVNACAIEIDGLSRGKIHDNSASNRIGSGGNIRNIVNFVTGNSPNFSCERNIPENLNGPVYESGNDLTIVADSVRSNGEIFSPIEPTFKQPISNICDYSVKQVTTSSTASSATVVAVTSGGAFLVGNEFALELTDGSIHFSTVASVSSNNVTINDATPSISASGNKVWTYRITDGAYAGGKQAFEGTPSATTNRDAMIAAGIMDPS